MPPIIPISPFVPGHFASKCCLALVEPSCHKDSKNAQIVIQISSTLQAVVPDAK